MPTTAAPKNHGTARHLIETMTNSDALPVFVRQIDPHTLKNLVDEVGIEDAGALIAHVSQNQLVHLLDETIWTGASPGDPDKLSVAELLRWLDLWNGLGAGFVADKLYELGEDFCALAFSRLLVISDYDMAPKLLDEHTQAIGRHLVRVRIDDEWDTVQTAVNALWHDFPDYAEAIFGRLSFRHSILRMFGEDDQAGVIDADASHEHEQGREEAGYVTSIMAGSFLRDLAAADVDQLSAESEYDPQSQDYFRRRDQLRRDAEVATSSADTAEDEVVETGAAATSAEDVPVDQAELASLSMELAAYERARSRPAALLTGPETAAVQESDWIRVALGRLQSDAERFDTSLDELSYLANLLMAGTDVGGERLESGPAANLVVSTCNLGASHELWLANETEPVGAVLEMVRSEPGLIRLFRIGWHLLVNLPVEAAERLVALFASETARERLAPKPWVISEVDALLSAPDYVETVAARNFEDARETLKILGIALEPVAVVVLCVLTDGVPRYARVLDGAPPDGAVMTYASRDLCTMSDLLTVHRYLDSLAEEVRL